jgi:hypothetical protein
MVQFQEAQTEGEAPNGQPEEPDYYALFNAPDFTTLLRPAQTKLAKEYTEKTNSVLKALLVGSLNAGDFPDAAAILKHGPGFASATGQLCDSSERARGLVEMITSPASPLTMFVMTAIPLVGQVIRNHEAQIAQIPETRRQRRMMRKATVQAKAERKPRFTIRMFGRAWPIYANVSMPKWSKVFAGFRTQTVEPDLLAAQVFTDPAVIKALQKMGVVLVNQSEAESG